MKRLPLTTSLVFLFSFLLVFTLTADISAQEGPVTMEGLQPDAGFPDTEMEIWLVGRGFSWIEEMEIFMDDIEILDFDIESDDSIRLAIFIPPDAPPGPKTVALSYVLDNTPFRAVLRNSFQVMPPDERLGARLALFAVEPAEGARDAEMEVRLLGAGFESAGGVAVRVEDIEIQDQWIESDEVIALRIYIPGDTWPGGHRVEVAGEDGQRAVLAEGFNILETDQPPPPTPRPGGNGGRHGSGLSIDWIWPLATIVLMAASYALGRGLAFRSQLSWTKKAKLQWRNEAKTKLPEPKKACQWACKATSSANLLNRWQVNRIELTPLDVKGKTAPQRVVDNRDGTLDPLNDLTNIADALRSPQAVRQQLAGVVEAVLAQIMAWEKEGQSPASVRLDAQLAGTIDATFGLYHCHQTSSGLSWGKEPLLKWKGKINQPAGECLGVLRGPAAGETDFAVRARREIEDSFLELIDSVRLWL